MNRIVTAVAALAVAGAFGIATPAFNSANAQDKPAAGQQKKVKKAGKAAKGAPSKGVMALQEALNKNGANLKVDGRMGKATRAALKDYQSKNGLKATGRLDKATRAKLGI